MTQGGGPSFACFQVAQHLRGKLSCRRINDSLLIPMDMGSAMLVWLRQVNVGKVRLREVRDHRDSRYFAPIAHIHSAFPHVALQNAAQVSLYYQSLVYEGDPMKKFVRYGVVLAILGIGSLGVLVNMRSAHAASPAPSLSVSGAKLLGNGQPLFLHGANYSGGEYACIQGYGIWDGSSDQAFVNTLLSANVNSVALPLNEDCWLGINGVNSAYGGANYQNAVVSFVNLLASNGITPEVRLAWVAPGTQKAQGQPVMPDADHSSDFWASAAAKFAGRSDVVLDLYGEPHPNGGWNEWLNGGTDGYQTVGMQSLLNTVRSAGYHGVVSLSGIDWANTLGGSSGWLAHMPNDPDNKLVASVHVYKGNTHDSTAAWQADYGATAAQVPLIAGEMGAYRYDDAGGYQSAFATEFWNWLASVGGDGTEAWTWDTWGTVEALVSNYSGPTLTQWGQQMKAQYATYGGGGSPPPTPTQSATATVTPPTPTSTATPPSPTVTPPSPTPVPPTPTPPPGGGGTGRLTLVQSASQFIDYAGVNESYAKFNKNVTAGHLLVVIVSIAGGNPYVVDHIEDDLGNTWRKAVSGSNGDETDVEIWYSNGTHSGPDEVDAYLKVLPGATSKFLQSYVTVSEWNGTAALHSAHAARSRGKGTHSSGLIATSTGDLILGGYADAGYVAQLSIADGKTLLGKKFDNLDAIQAIESYGTAKGSSDSILFANPRFSRAVVAGASFTPHA
jgi:hypothetical protein